MILADKIIQERKKNGWSQEELAEQLGVSRQSVSKWESAGSIPDLQRIIQLAQLFHVSTDYLLKDDMETSEVMNYEELNASSESLYRVSMEEANAYIAHKRKYAPKIGNAVSLCITCPVLLIVLAGLAEREGSKLSENLACGIGLIWLFAAIIVAIIMFVKCGIKDESIKALNKLSFETEYGVTGMVREKRKDYENTYTVFLVTGIILCIVSVVPLIIGALAELPDYMLCILTALLLCIIAVGVNMIIRVSMVKESYDVLLQEGEFSREEKKVNRTKSAVAGAFWCLAAAIYIGWSFYTNDWEITWIVWPIAGVLYAVLANILKLVIHE